MPMTVANTFFLPWMKIVFACVCVFTITQKHNLVFWMHYCNTPLFWDIIKIIHHHVYSYVLMLFIHDEFNKYCHKHYWALQKPEKKRVEVSPLVALCIKGKEGTLNPTSLSSDLLPMTWFRGPKWRMNRDDSQWTKDLTMPKKVKKIQKEFKVLYYSCDEH